MGDSGVVAQMRVDLEATRREAGKLENQLTCLIQLVRRAWMGDTMAASDVAKIVGVAPPEYSLQHKDDMVAISAEPRSKVLHNWVALTVGLLNLDFRRSQEDALQYQHGYLAERNDYLNDQISQHDEMLGSNVGGVRYDTSVRSFLEQEMDKKNQGSRPPTGRKRLQHLYRPPQQTEQQPDDQRTESSLTWGDLFVKGYHKNEQSQANQSRKTRIQFSDGDRNASYSNPDRYSKLDLFELALANDTPQRPVKRVNSMDRARPKSSVHRVNSATRGRTPNQAASQRPRTAYVSLRQPQPVFNTDFTVHPVREPSPELVIKRSAPQSGSAPSVPHLGRALSEQLRQDAENEAYYEREFRKTASQLQKKLGITLNGMI